MAKATRRDLRRAIGVSVLDTMQGLEVSMGSLGIALNACRTDVAQLARDHAVLKRTYLEHVNRQTAFDEATQTRWQRLRWVLGL